MGRTEKGPKIRSVNYTEVTDSSRVAILRGGYGH